MRACTHTHMLHEAGIRILGIALLHAPASLPDGASNHHHPASSRPHDHLHHQLALRVVAISARLARWAALCERGDEEGSAPRCALGVSAWLSEQVQATVWGRCLSLLQATTSTRVRARAWFLNVPTRWVRWSRHDCTNPWQLMRVSDAWVGVV